MKTLLLFIASSVMAFGQATEMTPFAHWFRMQKANPDDGTDTFFSRHITQPSVDVFNGTFFDTVALGSGISLSTGSWLNGIPDGTWIPGQITVGVTPAIQSALDAKMSVTDAEDAIETMETAIDSKASASSVSTLSSQVAGKFNIPSGSNSQYVRGDGTLATLPTIPTTTSQLTNNSGFLTAEVDGSVTNEIELPSQTGQSGKILGTNGTSVSWQAAPSSFNPGTPSTATAWTSGTAFQPNASGPSIVYVAGSLTGVVAATGSVKVEISATSGGTYYTTNPSTTFLIALLGVVNDRDCGSVIVPAGWWVKITATGSVTGTYVKQNI